MSIHYLLDTNVVSEPLRPHPNPAVLRRIRAHEGQVAIPSPVWHELRFGCERLPASRRRETVERYLAEVVAPNLPMLAYDDAAADWHARERARLERMGTPPPFADGQIAAIARVSGLTLVTADQRHFRRFENLLLEDWTNTVR